MKVIYLFMIYVVHIHSSIATRTDGVTIFYIQKLTILVKSKLLVFKEQVLLDGWVKAFKAESAKKHRRNSNAAERIQPLRIISILIDRTISMYLAEEIWVLSLSS